MILITEFDFFTNDKSEFHQFPDDDKAVIHLLLNSINTSANLHRLKRFGLVVMLLAISYFLYTVVATHVTETIVVVIAFIFMIALFTDGQFFGAAEVWRKKIVSFVFEDFGDTTAYINAESGIVAILQRNGFTLPLILPYILVKWLVTCQEAYIAMARIPKSLFFHTVNAELIINPSYFT